MGYYISSGYLESPNEEVSTKTLIVDFADTDEELVYLTDYTKPHVGVICYKFRDKKNPIIYILMIVTLLLWIARYILFVILM